MKLGFIVGSFQHQQQNFTTCLLAQSALERGHSVFFTSPDKLSQELGGAVYATGARFNPGNTLEFDRRLSDRICLNDLDAVWLRFNPFDKPASDPLWQSGLEFAFRLKAAGIAVINDPSGLCEAAGKSFTESLVPNLAVPSFVARDTKHISHFLAESTFPLVLKPLHGSGGKGVFKIPSNQDPRLETIIHSITRSDFLVVQPFIDAPLSKRLLLVDGESLVSEEKTAIYQRASQRGEFRSNIKLGAAAEKVPYSDSDRSLVAEIGPKLREMGLFFVGLDLIGDKLLEVNVFCTGGLSPANRLHGVDFGSSILQSVEQKFL